MLIAGVVRAQVQINPLSAMEMTEEDDRGRPCAIFGNLFFFSVRKKTQDTSLISLKMKLFLAHGIEILL